MSQPAEVSSESGSEESNENGTTLIVSNKKTNVSLLPTAQVKVKGQDGS